LFHCRDSDTTNTVKSPYQLSPSTPTSEIRGYQKYEHSLAKPYQVGGNWDFVGNTFITNEYIRLTPNLASLHGGLWNTVPVRSRDWELMVTVKIHGSTGEMYGDGMAIWYVKDRDFVGNVSEVFGYKNMFDGMGVFIDTYSNHNGPHNHAHPYISAMVAKGDAKYDHDTDGTHTQLGSDKGCTARLRNKDYDTNLLIRYVEDTVSVYIDIDNAYVWRECFSVGEVRLPTGYYIGLSAATGDLSDNHDIIAVKMYEIDVPRAEREQDVDRSQIRPEAKHFASPR
uniref:L-type lectin-like domain-containing protein n=1 Tax=Romanomermis culicivorax TaxID=13658 RepID=A0A915HYC9_ROMCU